jgi:4-hydroxy-3-methylbut-2-enyl diphosphate reductase
MRKVEIDQESGFCFGVVNAINHAEQELASGEELCCLGDIVHNSQEVNRLQNKGLFTIDHEQLQKMHQGKVLLRAHGEPPSTYETANRNGVRIIDATCPVVLRLQKKIRKYFRNLDENTSQIVIFGKNGHAEVNGLVGQTGGKAFVVENKPDLAQLDFNKDTYLFSQTTMSVGDFREVVSDIQSRIKPGVKFEYFDTICRQVANRIPNIKQFAMRHDLILFVAGEKSSNGKVLFGECKKANPNTKLISGPDNIELEWLEGVETIGICGATSTPKWLMEKVAHFIKNK